MEVTLEEIMDAIENDNPDLLGELLKNGKQHINSYTDVGDSVHMTPLLFAIKMKSPACVDVLVFFGADLDLSIKLSESSDVTKVRSLHMKALGYAIGERDSATTTEDITVYEEIIEILNEAKSKNKASKTSSTNTNDTNESAPQTTPQKPSISAPAPAVTHSPLASSNQEGLTISAIALADTHKLTQKIISNQLAITKLTDENENLKKDVEQLRKDIERFRPWIEKWIFESSEAIHPPPIEVMTVRGVREIDRKRPKHRSQFSDDSEIKKDSARRRPQSTHPSKPTLDRTGSEKDGKIRKAREVEGEETRTTKEKDQTTTDSTATLLPSASDSGGGGLADSKNEKKVRKERDQLSSADSPLSLSKSEKKTKGLPTKGNHSTPKLTSPRRIESSKEKID